MLDLLLGVLILGMSLLVAAVVFLAREGRISSRVLLLLTGVCSIGLLAMLVTDWPSEVLAEFWAEHSVVAGVLSTLLLVGVGFLAFEVRDVRQQEDLDRSLTAAGLGGLVDHVVDVEVALALACAEGPPEEHGWPAWSEQGRPLRWLRTDRDRLARTEGGHPGPLDPRRFPVPTKPDLHADSAWRIELIDQSVRRLLAAIRDWSPVAGRSRNGLQALITMAEIRNSLMQLETAVAAGASAEVRDLVLSVRRDCRILAYALEAGSGAPAPRPEVLMSIAPLGLEERAGTTGRGWLKNDWQVQLERAASALVGGRR